MTHHAQLPSTVIDHVVTAGSLDEALAWLARPGTKPIAGGTDLMIELDRGQHRELATLVDLTRIAGLDRIERSGDTITIGPLVTHNQCVASELLRSVAVPLVQASWEVGSPQLRNRATIAGNIVTASPANDTLSALVALDAELTLSSTRGERRIAIADFHLGVRRTALEHGELLTAISFPALGPDHRSIYLKLGLRRAQAISVVHVAVVARLSATGSAADNGAAPTATDGANPAAVEEIRIALGSVAPTIVRATEAESMLVGCSLDDVDIAAAATAAAASVEPIDDLRAPARYRTDMVAEMVTRALVAIRASSAVLPQDPPMLWGTSSGLHRTGADHAVEHRGDAGISAEVNGATVSGPGVGASLLDWLRANGLTGIKEGCAEGECGSCTVDLDGMAVLGCLVPATRAEGSRVVTIEGLAATAGGTADPSSRPESARSGGGLHPLQRAFVAAGAVQCGFCIPGFLMSGAKLLEEHPNPTEEQIKAGLSGNLCRCTGYYKIEDAVRVALDGGGGGDR